MIGIIAAVSTDNVIGVDGKLPFNYPEDLAHFKKTTLNSIVIMGRKTFESIGKPLANRKNIVVSKTISQIHDVEIFTSLEEAIAKYKNNNIWLIGGYEIYRKGLEFAEKIVLTITPDIIEKNNENRQIIRFPIISPFYFYEINKFYLDNSPKKLQVIEYQRRYL